MGRRKCENLYLSGAQSGVWCTSCLAEEFIWVGERICIFQYMIVAAVVVIIGEFIKVGGREEFVFDAIVALFNPIQCSCTIHSMIVAILPDLPVWCHLYVSARNIIVNRPHLMTSKLYGKQTLCQKVLQKKARKNVAYL